MTIERSFAGGGEERSGNSPRGTSAPDVNWADIDASLARSQPRLLAELRNAVLIETWQSSRTSRFLRFVWDDVDACVTLTLDDFEGMRYVRALRDYLEGVDYATAIDPDDLVALKPASGVTSVDVTDTVEGLLDLMLSDRLAHAFFRDAAGRAVEPVLADLLELIAVHKERRVSHAARLIARHLEAYPGPEAPILGAALQVRMPGNRPIREIEVTGPGQVATIRTLAARIERLFGVPIEDHLDDSA